MSDPVMAESNFTHARDECPRPELWEAFDTDSAELEVGDFLYGLVRMLKPLYVLETGSAFGHTTWEIAAALGQNDYGSCISLEVDGERARIAAERCRKLPVEVIVCDSLRYPGEPRPDLAFFDSDVAMRYDEWVHYQPNWAVFHDTGSHRPAVQQQINWLVEGGLIEPPLWFPTPRGLCLARRRET